MSDNNLLPYPQFLPFEKGAGWLVKDSGGGSSPAYVATGNKGERVMQVPLEGPCILCLNEGKTRTEASHARAIRNHEQAHLRFTADKKGRLPRTPKGLRPEYWNAVEDIRMDMCIRAVGVDQPPILCHHESPKFIHRFAEAPDYMRVLWVASGGLRDHPLLREWVKAACEQDDPAEGRLDADSVVRIADEAWARMQRGASSRIFNPQRQTWEQWPKMKNTTAIARWLQNLLDSMGADPRGATGQQGQQGDPSGQEQQQGQEQEQSGGEPEELDPSEFDPEEHLPQAEAEAEEVEDDDDERTPAPYDPNDDVAGTQWGRMVIDDPFKARALPGRLRRSARPSSYGEVPVSFERWMTDQKIFEQVRKHAGGTIVIDASGSMSLSQQQIYDWLEQFPGVKVAAYCGDEDFGTLRILADKGRVVDEELMQPPGSYNLVDGPALAWMCKQDAPRIWISDGHVNGVNGNGGKHLDFDRDMLLARGKIAWVDPNTVGWDKVDDWVVRMLRKGTHRGGKIEVPS